MLVAFGRGDEVGRHGGWAPHRREYLGHVFADFFARVRCSFVRQKAVLNLWVSFVQYAPRMEEVHRALMKAVSALRDLDLERKVPTSSRTRPLIEVLHGLAAHDAYHAGQIRLTRKLLRGR